MRFLFSWMGQSYNVVRETEGRDRTGSIQLDIDYWSYLNMFQLRLQLVNKETSRGEIRTFHYKHLTELVRPFRPRIDRTEKTEKSRVS